jgi:hypothetical protein
MRTFVNRLLTVALLGILFGPFVMAGITTTKNPGNITYVGSVPDQGDLNQYLSDVKANGSPLMGTTQIVSNVVAAGQLMSASTMVNQYIRRTGAGAITDTIDSAVNILAAMPGAKVGDSFWFVLANFNTGTLTLSNGVSPAANITLNGTLTIAQSAARFFIGQISAVGATPTVVINGAFSTPSITQ